MSPPTQAELAELFGVGRSTVYRTSTECDPCHQNRSGHSHIRESSGVNQRWGEPALRDQVEYSESVPRLATR
jgi:hypothetical protein